MFAVRNVDKAPSYLYYFMEFRNDGGYQLTPNVRRRIQLETERWRTKWCAIMTVDQAAEHRRIYEALSSETVLADVEATVKKYQELDALERRFTKISMKSRLSLVV